MVGFSKNINWTLLIALGGLILGIYNTFVKPWMDKPVLNGEIQHIVTGEILPPIKINEKEYPASLLIYFYVTNYKEKPVKLLNKYKLYVQVKKNKFLDLFGTKMQARPYYFNPDTIFHFAEGKQPGGFNFKRDYLLIKDNLDPVLYGGLVKGWISFVFPLRREEFMKEGTEFLLIIEDVFKRKYKIKYVFKEREKGSMFFPISQMSTP